MQIIIVINSMEASKDDAQTLVNALEAVMQTRITAGTASLNAQSTDNIVPTQS
jgi:hypothetical protein